MSDEWRKSQFLSSPVTRHGVPMADYTIHPLNDDDREWVKQFIAWQWGAEIIVLHGAVYRAETLPGFVAICGDEIAGLVTYHIQGDACEIITLDSLEVGIGIGTALIDAVQARAPSRMQTPLAHHDEQ
jgi:hypothetical protein